MMRLLLKLLLKKYVKNLSNPGEIDSTEREDGYIALFNSPEMMKNLQKILVEDTKQMMMKDVLNEQSKWMRLGMFIRTKALYDKAIMINQQSKNNKPEYVNQEKE